MKLGIVDVEVTVPKTSIVSKQSQPLQAASGMQEPDRTRSGASVTSERTYDAGDSPLNRPMRTHKKKKFSSTRTGATAATGTDNISEVSSVSPSNSVAGSSTVDDSFTDWKDCQLVTAIRMYNYVKGVSPEGRTLKEYHDLINKGMDEIWKHYQKKRRAGLE